MTGKGNTYLAVACCARFLVDWTSRWAFAKTMDGMFARVRILVGQKFDVYRALRDDSMNRKPLWQLEHCTQIEQCTNSVRSASW